MLKHIDMNLCGNVWWNISTELVDVISHCVILIHQIKSIVSVEVYEPERSTEHQIRYWNKSFYNGVVVYSQFLTSCSSVRMSRILDQLTQLIATSKERTDWRKCPKNWQTIRKQQPETLESKKCHAFPVKSHQTQVCIASNFLVAPQFSFLCERF